MAKKIAFFLAAVCCAAVFAQDAEEAPVHKQAAPTTPATPAAATPAASTAQPKQAAPAATAPSASAEPHEPAAPAASAVPSKLSAAAAAAAQSKSTAPTAAPAATAAPAVSAEPHKPVAPSATTAAPAATPAEASAAPSKQAAPPPPAATAAQPKPAAAPAAPAAHAAQIASNDNNKRFITVYITGVTSDKERRVLGNEILYALVKSGRCVPAERSNDFLDAVAREQKPAQRIGDVRLRELAKQFGIRFLCVGEMTEVMNTYQLSTRIINLETAEVEVVGKAYSDLKSVSDFAEVTSKIMESMFGKKKGM